MTKITAPFSSEQVDALNRWQHLGYVPEFNCEEAHEGLDRRLAATRHGWICPHCAYRQDWAHVGMLSKPEPPFPAPDYRNVAAAQGTIIIRLRLALEIARAWGLNGKEGYSALIAFDIGKWIDSGMEEPIPYFEGSTFKRWATDKGLSNIGGKLGYRLVAKMKEAPSP